MFQRVGLFRIPRLIYRTMSMANVEKLKTEKMKAM